MKKRKIDEFSAPFHVALNVTSRCQLECPYCYSFNDGSDIPLEKYRSIVDELIEINCFEICIAGGEPFLHKDIIPMLKYLIDNRKGQRLSLVNNGMSLSPKIADQLVRVLSKDDSSGSHFTIQLSIDSHLEKVNQITRVKSNLNLIEKNLKYLLSLGFKDLQIGSVLNKFSAPTYREMVEHYYSMGVRHFHLMHMEFPNHRDEKELRKLSISNEQFLDVMKVVKELNNKYSDIEIVDAYNAKYQSEMKPTIQGVGCTAGVTHCEILANLDVIPCGTATEFVMGSLKDSDFKSIWNSVFTRALRREKRYLCNKTMPY